MEDREKEAAFDLILEEAKLRLELPQLLVAVLDLNPEVATRCLRDWAAKGRPTQQIFDELKSILGGEGPRK